jgi:hypothetical protein
LLMRSESMQGQPWKLATSLLPLQPEGSKTTFQTSGQQ